MKTPAEVYSDLMARAAPFLSLPVLPAGDRRVNPNQGKVGRFASGGSKGVAVGLAERPVAVHGAAPIEQPGLSEDLNGRATQFLTLPDLPPSLHARHPGHGSQKVHAGRKGSGSTSVAPTNGGAVRPALAGAGTADEVSSVITSEVKRITGRKVAVDMAGSDVQTAREHGEGILQGFERYPKTYINGVHTYGPGSARPNFTGHDDAYAFTHRGFSEIGFNTRYAADPKSYKDSLRNSAAGGWLTAATPRGVALHEFGHILGNDAGLVQRIGRDIVKPGAEKAGITPSKFIDRGVSGYAKSSRAEMVAEAFADVMHNRRNATKLSHQIFDYVDINARFRG